MTGEFNHTMDSKGRLFIPARLREKLGASFYVTVSDEKCLWAFSAESWNDFVTKVREMTYMERKKMRPFFSSATRCDVDAQGRALIPQNLRQYADLKKNITVLGCDDHAEIWNSDIWEPINKKETSPLYIGEVLKEINF